MTKRLFVGFLFACVLPFATYASTKGAGMEPAGSSSTTSAGIDESVPSLQSVRPEFRTNEVRVDIQTKGQVQYKDFALQNPDRVVLDFPGVRSALGTHAIPLMANQFVRQIRVGQPQPGVTRLVLDTTASVEYRVTQEDSMVIVSLGAATETRPRTVADTVSETSTTMNQSQQDFQGEFGSVPRLEVFGGYTLERVSLNNLGHYNGNGGEIQAAVNFGRYLGLTVDFSTVAGGPSINSLATKLDQNLGGSGQFIGFPSELDFHNYTLMTGPRLAVRKDRLSGYLHAIVGVAHVDYTNFNQALASFDPFLLHEGFTLSGRESTSIAAAFGGGFDLQLNHVVSLRLGQVDYMVTHFQELAVPAIQPHREFQNNVRFSTGLVFRFGDATQ